jgi:hypothetical protein
MDTEHPLHLPNMLTWLWNLPSSFLAGNGQHNLLTRPHPADCFPLISALPTCPPASAALKAQQCPVAVFDTGGVTTEDISLQSRAVV